MRIFPKTGAKSDSWRRAQAAGIAEAKAAGRYSGRPAPARARSAEVLQLSNDGVGPSEIAARVGICEASVFRILATAKKESAS